MKKIKIGNILTADEGIIVHGCNAQGVMGAGLAAQIRQKWPGCYKEYFEFVQNEKNKIDLLGKVIPYNIAGEKELIIANCITQYNFGRDNTKYVSYDALQKCFETVISVASISGLEIHYPLIGAGLAGGEWSIISEIIDNCFNSISPDLPRTLWILD